MRTEQRFRATILALQKSPTPITAAALGLAVVVGAIALPGSPSQAQIPPDATNLNTGAPTTTGPVTPVSDMSDRSLDEPCQTVSPYTTDCRQLSDIEAQPNESSPSVGQAVLPFSDVPPDHWAYDALLFLSFP